MHGAAHQHVDCPAGRPLMRMQWRDLLFLHWPVSIETLRPLIPESLKIDTFDGHAWVGLVPFTMRDVLPAVIPAARALSDVPRLSAFHECNVRTYVRPRNGWSHTASNGDGGEAGVWFFSLDAASRLAVWGARKFFHLNYFRAEIGLKRGKGLVEYSVNRIGSPGASLRCSWRIGEALPPSKAGELEHFLTERYALYTVSQCGRLLRCRIHHDPWPLRKAELMSLDDGLVKSAGISLMNGHAPASVFHGADVLDVRVWPLEVVTSIAS